MDVFKKYILAGLLLFNSSAIIHGDVIQPAPAHNIISDQNFDAIITNPWGNLSFADKEKIGLYLFDKLQKKNLNLTINICAKITKYKDYLKDLASFTPALTLTPTDKHIIRYPEAVENFINNRIIACSWYGPKNYKMDTSMLQPIVEDIYAQTKILEAQGYKVFFHGHRWELTLLQRFYKDLYQAYYNALVPTDFTFIHLKRPNKNYSAQVETTQREAIIQSRNGWMNASDALFMNKPLFGNSNFYPSNSFHFFLENFNEGTAQNIPSLRDIFSYFDAEYLYQKYESAFIILEQLHAHASTYGNFLAIAIPKDLVKKCVFKTRNNSKDQREYCLVMTHDIALNPASGIKVFAFNKPDKDKYAEFEAEYDQILRSIMNDLKAQQP